MKKSIESSDICYFSRQLASLISAQVPVIQSLDIIKHTTKLTQLKLLIETIQSSLKGGQSLSSAMRRQSRYFDHLYCSLVESGEISGTLDIMLERIAAHQERIQSLKRKLKKALMYPTLIILIAIIISVILLMWVTPQFEQLFSSLDVALPHSTQIMIQLGKFLNTYGLLMLGVLGVLIWGLQHFRLFRFCLSIPMIGNLYQKAMLARFARTLATLFAAGVPIQESLKLISNLFIGTVYHSSLQMIQTQVTKGTAIHVAMASNKLFPYTLTQMIAIGEQSGTLDKMLLKVASIYEEEVDTSLDNLMHLLEPAMIILLGILIGGMVISLYLPIFKMGTLF